MKSLVIAEKPSVAMDIAKVLGCRQKGKGFLYNDTYIVSWAIGHLVELCEPGEYKEEWKKWSFQTLPIIPEEIKIRAIPKTRPQLEILYGLMKSKEVDKLICATDSGREGELIFRYIYEITKCRKPFDRLWISSMTDKAIKDGFKNLKSGSFYDNLYNSAKCRSEADWLVGMNASRAFAIKYNTHLSIGRVQTPTLSLIVARQKEIDNFVPKDYWEVEAKFNDYKAIWIDEEANDTKIFDKKKAEDTAKLVKGKEGIVKSVNKEEKKMPPPLLYDLTELQRDCNKKFGFSAQKTLAVAQDLYEKRKLITYPRTDSRYLSNDMVPKINVIISKLSNASEYAEFANRIQKLQKLPITKRIVNNSKITDHHAIIPTESKINLQVLKNDEMNVYDLIARRFMAVFFPYYIYSVTKIITLCEGNSFITKGNTVIQKGWTELNISNKKDDILPSIEQGEAVKNKAANAKAKKTKAPQPYNDAELLSSMENAGRFVEDEELKEQLKESGLGTPATRAAIIERLLNIGYIERKGKNIFPTEKGKKLTEVVPSELKSPEITGEWEKRLNLISKGNMESKEFMADIQRYVAQIVEQAKASKIKTEFPADKSTKTKGKKFRSFGKCPLCGRDILENTKAFYCAGWNAGCGFKIWKDILSGYDSKLGEKDLKKLLNDKKIEAFKIKRTSTNENYVVDIILKESGTVVPNNLRKK